MDAAEPADTPAPAPHGDAAPDAVPVGDVAGGDVAECDVAECDGSGPAVWAGDGCDRIDAATSPPTAEATPAPVVLAPDTPPEPPAPAAEAPPPGRPT